MSEAIAVQVLDPSMDQPYTAQLVKSAAGFRIDRTRNGELTEKPQLYLSPAWIDLHAHVYDGVTSLSVPADNIGLRTGVHMVVDAGSAGEATLPGFMKYVVPQSQTEIRAWLNISSIGLVHLREVASLETIHIDRTVKAVLDHRPFVCGVKVRSSGAIVGEMGLQPLQLAKLAAREAGVPLMVHIGEAPPVIDGVLDLLDEGDVVTHCFHGKTGHPWEKDGKPGRALLKALDRGVLLDVGHGAASFHFGICKQALAAGYLPSTISTDLHIRNIGGPVYNLATTMTKLLACGMTLGQVIAAVTAEPAKVLRLPNWCDFSGMIKRATVFRLADSSGDGNGPEYRDAQGNKLTPDRVIVPTAVITAGQWTSLNDCRLQ